MGTHKIHDIELDDFTYGYLVCAIWSSTHPDYQTERETEDTPETLDEYDPYDFSLEGIVKALENCKAFQELAGDLLLERESYNPHEGSLLAHAGHDFWLTHNGHGAGFWDGRYPDEVGETLTEMSKKFGELYIWINSENQLEFE